MQCPQPLALTATDAAKGLGVTRQALSDLVNEKAGISVEMAIRLSKAFGVRILAAAETSGMVLRARWRRQP